MKGHRWWRTSAPERTAADRTRCCQSWQPNCVRVVAMTRCRARPRTTRCTRSCTPFATARSRRPGARFGGGRFVDGWADGGPPRRERRHQPARRRIPWPWARGAVVTGSTTTAVARGAACPSLVTPRRTRFDLLDRGHPRATRYTSRQVSVTAAGATAPFRRRAHGGWARLSVWAEPGARGDQRGLRVAGKARP
jgi:hypothetical protein